MDGNLGQALTGSQCRQQQWRGLVEHLRDFDRFVNALTGWLTRLRIARNDHFVAEALNHDLVFMPFLVGVAD
ncbi:hypothetical protein D3C86_2099550 [compost metagenome]